MIRIVIQEDDAGMAANVGGCVKSTCKTFDVDLPEVEAYLSEPQQKGWRFTQRSLVGIELKDTTTKEKADGD